MENFRTCLALGKTSLEELPLGNIKLHFTHPWIPHTIDVVQSTRTKAFQDLKLKLWDTLGPLFFPKRSEEIINLLNIISTRTPETLVGWIRALPLNSVIGFDTEFVSNRLCTVQLCFQNNCIVYHVATSWCPFPSELQWLLRSPSMIKVGFDLRKDRLLLQKALGRLPWEGWIDLKIQFPPGSGGLKEISATMLQFHMPKEGVTCNWAHWPLEKKSIHYAALDAYASSQLYLMGSKAC